jgi:hypothetical protein
MFILTRQLSGGGGVTCVVLFAANVFIFFLTTHELFTYHLRTDLLLFSFFTLAK